MARDNVKALDWDLQDSETVMFIIVQNPYFVQESRLIQDKHTRCILYAGPPDVPMFNFLLLEVLQDPTRI